MKLSIQDSAIIIGLHRLVSDMDRRTKAICKVHDLTIDQFAVLEALNNKGDLTVGQVKELVLSSDGTIPVVTKNLEKAGYITRTQAEDDKRKFILSLTKQGKDIVQEVIPENNDALTSLLSTFTGEEKKQLTEIIKKYRSNNN